MKIEIIKHSEEPDKWNALHIAGESNIYVGIVQLRRIGFSFEEIRGLLNTINKKVLTTQTLERKDER
jgi:hypothetical protein